MDLSRLCFLIVEDNYHMRRILMTILRGFGVGRVIDAPDAADAIECLNSHPVDIIITDLNMQPLDGLEFTRLVRQSSDVRNRYVPIILLTAHSERSKVEAARDAGVTEFCRKPVSAQNLLQRIQAVIETPRPFVKTHSFVGPDRRRQSDAPAKDLKRRKSDSV